MLSPRAQHANFIRLLDKYELRLTVRLTRSKNIFIKQASEEYIGHPNDVFHEPYIELVERTQAILTTHYRRMIRDFGRLTLAGLKCRKQMETKAESLFEQFIAEWIATYSLRNARLTASTTRADVREAIQRGIDEGLGTRAIAGLIRKVSTLSRFRAEVISRTETHNAATFGSIETVRAAQEETGVTIRKFWVPTLDERTRENHRVMNSHPGIPLDKKFIVGGAAMDRPGDPAGGAKNVINCRCALIYREVEDENNG